MQYVVILCRYIAYAILLTCENVCDIGDNNIVILPTLFVSLCMGKYPNKTLSELQIITCVYNICCDQLYHVRSVVKFCLAQCIILIWSTTILSIN